jgi:RND family efflux transporter MFP subunit
VTPAAPVPTALSPVEVTTVAPQDLVSTIRLTGTLNPVRRSVLAAQVSAPLLDVAVKPGQSVKEGDVLIRFDPTQLQLQVDQAKSSLASAQAQRDLAQTTLNNTQTLVDRNVSPRSALDKAENDVTAAEANVAGMRTQLKAAETQLGYATIRAPMSGVVSERRVDPGDTVAAGSPLLTVVDLTELEVEVVIPASVIDSVSVGQTAELAVDGIDGRTFTATVDRISPLAVAATRTIPVYLSIENPDGLLKGGMFTSGEVVVDRKTGAIALPLAAIRSDSEGTYVLAIENGVLARRAVTEGRAWNNGQTVEIATGVAAGDTIVTAPLPTLAAGTPVVIEQG